MENKKYTVLVMMSTYNGEKYLREQLDSIIGQNGVNLHITIRDDGSSDATVSTLEQYSQEYENISYVSSQRNLGPGNSFMNLLYESGTFDYYAFSDQDDIWLPDKLIRAIGKIKDASEPMLYGSNQKLVFTDGTSRLRYEKAPAASLLDVLFANHISGCTMVMNHALRDIIVDPKHRPTEHFAKIRMHDTWFLLVALLKGSFVYDDEAFIEYRIHENNFVGISNDQVAASKRNVLKHLKYLLLGKSNHYIQLTAEELIRVFPEIKFDEYITHISNYRENFGSKVKLLKNETVFSHSNVSKRFYFENIMFNKL